MSTQDTESLFKKKMNLSIVILVFISVTMVIRGIRAGIILSDPSDYIPSLISDYIPLLIYAINLVVFAAIGKDKGKENPIMAFVFGICTIVLAALLILDCVDRIVAHIDSIISDIARIPGNPLYIPVAVLRSVGLSLIIVTLVFCILSIVNSVAIIKENAPKAKEMAAKSRGSASTMQPALTSPPPASSGTKPQFCSSCGGPLDSGAAFCNKCGAKA